MIEAVSFSDPSRAGAVLPPPLLPRRDETPPARANGGASPQDGERLARPTEVGSAEPVPPSGRPVAPLDLNSQTAAQEQRTSDTPDAAPPLISKKSDEGPDGLTEDERQKVQELRRRDREVRAHEQAHKTAGGGLAGQPQFQTVRGPDGRSYAVGGEVSIDTSPVPNNPDATIRKMEIVKRAALAPAQPSAADRQVAADANRKIQQARQEKREAEAEERAKTEETGDTQSDPVQPVRLNEIDAGGEPAFGRSDTGIAPRALFDIVA